MQVIGRFLEDFAVGQIFRSGRLRIDKERMDGTRRGEANLVAAATRVAV